MNYFGTMSQTVNVLYTFMTLCNLYQNIFQLLYDAL